MKHTKQQDKIINARNPRIIVVAGPGTGKTEVLAHYTIGQARTLTSKHSAKKKSAMQPILLFTHTNNAKDTMVDRLNEITSDQNILNSILCTTFHSFALRMISKYGRQSYNLDDNCNERIINKLIKRSREQDILTPKLIEQILSVYEDHVGMGLSIKRVLKRHYPQLLKYRSEIIKVIRQLERNKEKLGLVTQADLPTVFVKLMGKGVIPNTVLHRFKVVVVDEFQDTLAAQWDIIQGLAGPKTRLLVAGDPNQTIFTWAGASYRRFDDFRKEFPRYTEYHLTRNQRNSRQIVLFCSGLLAQSKYPVIIKNQSKRDRALPLVVCSSDNGKILKYLVKQIHKLLKKGKSLDSIAVIYRFHREHRGLIPHLEQKGIPYKVYQKRTRRIRSIVSLVFAFIYVVETPHHARYTTSVSDQWRVILTNLEGVGIKHTDSIMKWLKARQPDNYTYPKSLRFTSVLRDLLKAIDVIKSETITGPDRLKAIVDLVYQMPKVNKSDVKTELASLFYLAHTSKSLGEIIQRYEDISYPTCYPAGSTMPPFPDSYLTLSTIHKIKGSEYDDVFYLGTDDFTFKKWNLFKGINKQHELLLMNVASSRARRKLTLLFPINIEDWKFGVSVSNPWTLIRKIPDKHFKLKVLSQFK